ncbi:ATP synthase protein I [Hoeflea marina]|uniref:ATP synthase protein I n=1 Tax=Hoeflea marina TaxID=274592 RepID=A0A317PYF6_9HYPH|nr:AtpZ/AtpI family protein [Hoeflea marina]PWW04540.1 ATP synthase protein I [Hoeflea marina]
MSGENSGPEDKDPLVREVRLRRERRETWLREGDMSIGRRLAQIGVLGWIIVAPMLGGLYAGRWLDRHFSSGLFWSAALLMVGLVLGGWFARKWIDSA